MIDELGTTMAKADAALEVELGRIFGELEARMLPGAAVESIYSHGFAEDGTTFCMMLEMADGTTTMISVCPGRPISVCAVA